MCSLEHLPNSARAINKLASQGDIVGCCLLTLNEVEGRLLAESFEFEFGFVFSRLSTSSTSHEIKRRN